MPTLSPSNCINVEHQGVEGGKFLRRRERLTRSRLVRLSVRETESGEGRDESTHVRINTDAYTDYCID